MGVRQLLPSLVSHVDSDGAAGTHPVGLLYAVENFTEALVLQSGSTPSFVASLAEQASSALSFLPIALILEALHLSALAGPAPTAMRTTKPIPIAVFLIVFTLLV